jgi:hypothetical protein
MRLLYEHYLRNKISVPKIPWSKTKLARALHPREKLVRERGAGSRDFISNFFEILMIMARQTYYRG